MKLLIVEDNEKLAKYMHTMFTEEGFAVDVLHDGEAGERRILNGNYDVVILDWMLPEKDGVEVCRDIRAASNITPILMLTARGELHDRVEGLDSGADDYVLKPFAMEELLARVRALLRRPATHVPQILTVGEVVLDTTTHTVTVSGNAITLTLKEFMVLEYLMRHVDQIVTREQILDHCWDFAYNAFSNITDVYIKQLRQKLGKDYGYIKTIRGVGYRFTTE